jgi:hypothetical protein
MRFLDAFESQHYHRVPRLTTNTARVVGCALFANADMPMQYLPDELRPVHHAPPTVTHDWLRLPWNKFCVDESAWGAGVQVYEMGRY